MTTLFIEIAESWCNIPYRLIGNSRFGCDCLGLILGVYRETLEKLNYTEYLKNFDQILKKERRNMIISKNQDKIIQKMENFFIKTNKITIGDIIQIKNQNIATHFAIVSNQDKIIHMCNTVKKVQYAELNQKIKKDIINIFQCKFPTYY